MYNIYIKYVSMLLIILRFLFIINFNNNSNYLIIIKINNLKKNNRNCSY
uniref:Uncharacterized protein n=1 Tax=viral metagenome TaxID=1070528 RepID=A0A6C0H963_9ZZZZ